VIVAYLKLPGAWLRCGLGVAVAECSSWLCLVAAWLWLWLGCGLAMVTGAWCLA